MVASLLRKGLGGKRVKMMLPSLIWIDFYVSFFDDPCHAFFMWLFFIGVFLCFCLLLFVTLSICTNCSSSKIDDEKKIS